jgi:pimeloyl-ACP methyl ester carboxylesterase
MAASETAELVTHDGHLIEYCLYGPPDGLPVLFHSGTPGSRLLSGRWAELIDECGVRVLLHDRPGYGGSRRRPGRTVGDVAADAAQLADVQGWDRFATFGISGGGPHALACAVLLSNRITRCASVVGPAPYDAEGLDWYQGMSPGNVREFRQAAEGEAAYRPLVEQLSQEALAAVSQGEPAIPAGYELPESDLAKMRERLGEEGHAERARASFGAVDGWVDDCIAMTRPWGISVADRAVPVTVWDGPDDVLCPRGHSEWLIAHVPGAERHEMAGGHFLPDDAIRDLLGWLTGHA